MNRPSIPELLRKGESYYSLIIGISKRARQIVSFANELEKSCPDNPVADAVMEFERGKYHLIESEKLLARKG